LNAAKIVTFNVSCIILAARRFRRFCSVSIGGFLRKAPIFVSDMDNRLFGTAMMIGVTILVMVFSPADAFAEKRIALAIGNSNYESVPKLPNPARDAIAIGQMLRDAHFDNVDVIINANNQELKRALRKFETDADQADIAVIYYAGHGLEIGGINYLIPVDARLASDRDAEDEAVRLDRVISSADSASRLRVIILDACRDNPFPSLMRQHGKGGRAVISGLGKTEPTSTDTLIAYAAKAGSTAEDGDGQHSPFTAAILKSLTIPGLDIRLAFGRVKDEVMRVTGSRQEPFVYGSLGGSNFPLVPAPKVQESSEADIRGDYELVAKVGTLRAWEVFLNTHKTGFYADLARAQVAALNEQMVGSSVTRSPAGGSAVDNASKAGSGNGNMVVAAVPQQQPPGGGGSSSQEALEWSRIKDSSDPAAFEKYIQKFPNATFAIAAQKKLDELRQAQREREAAQKAAEEARIQAEQKKAAEAAAKKREEDERRAREAEAEQKAKAAEAERKAEEARQKAEQAERERAAAEAAAARAAEEKQAREAEEARKKAERDAREAACKTEQSKLDQILAKGSAGPGMDDLKLFAATSTCERLAAQIAAATDKFRAEQARREREAAQKAAEEARIQAEQKKAEAAAARKREDDERRAKALEAEQQAKAVAEAAAKAKAAEDARKKTERDAKEAACKTEQSKLDQIVAKGSTGPGMDDLKSFAATSTCERLAAQIAAATDKFKAEQARRERDAAQKREDDERRAREVEAAEKAKAAAAELAAQKQREEDDRRAKALEAEQQAKAAEAKRKADQAEQERQAAEAAAARAAAEKQAKEDERRARQAEAEQKAKAAEAERLAAEEKRKAEQATKDAVCRAEQSKLEQIVAKGSAGTGIDDLNAFAKSVTCERLGAQIVAAVDKFQQEAAARAAAMPNSPQLIAAAQTQLVRLGCQLPGKPNGNLNDATTAALTRFLKVKGKPTDNLTVTTALVDDLTRQTDRVCPLECRANEVAKGDKCVVVEKPAPHPAPAVSRKEKEREEATVSRREKEREEAPARKPQPQPERRQAEQRRPALEQRIREQAVARPTGGGGGAMMGVGF
jgi:membrane protein involved in colicin uptake